jgi:acetyl-CoA/propionyl-CoA carboxylase biotin carboxyl carrier protein
LSIQSSEEVTGIDLVREQFRIAMGENLGFDDPNIRGHSIEFRINGEDPGRSFLTSTWANYRMAIYLPDQGYELMPVLEMATSLAETLIHCLPKLIVTGATRKQAIERARRALAEFTVGGLATALPFHRAILEDPAFTENFTVYTSYIENEFKNDIPAGDYVGTEIQTRVAAENWLLK